VERKDEISGNVVQQQWLGLTWYSMQRQMQAPEKNTNESVVFTDPLSSAKPGKWFEIGRDREKRKRRESTTRND
jgi:hypothetical protein